MEQTTISRGNDMDIDQVHIAHQKQDAGHSQLDVERPGRSQNGMSIVAGERDKE